MNLALFGGTFDPIHRGHLAIARGARRRFRLDRVLFIPADIPPHKQKRPISAFEHRYAMVALATAKERAFMPSLLDAPRNGPSYTIDTVRRVRADLPKSARLFFLIGCDAFCDFATWREPEAVLREVEFIVVSRPGYKLADAVKSWPERLQKQADARIHLLDGIKENVSATQIRQAAERGKPLGRWVGREVAEYIRRVELYRR